MTVPNFPQSPSDGDSFVSNGITYVWNANGSNEGYWQAQEEDGINAYWSKTGNTLSPTDAADGVEIGGGDITLNADGSGTFDIIASDEVRAGDLNTPWDNNQRQVLIGQRPSGQGNCGFVHIGSPKAGEVGDAFIVSGNTGTIADMAVVIKTDGTIEQHGILRQTNPVFAYGGFTNNAGNNTELNLSRRGLEGMDAVGNGGVGVITPGYYRIQVDILFRPNGVATDLVFFQTLASTSAKSDLHRARVALPSGEATSSAEVWVQAAAGDFFTFGCQTAGTGDLFGSIGHWSITYMHA